MESKNFPVQSSKAPGCYAVMLHECVGEISSSPFENHCCCFLQITTPHTWMILGISTPPKTNNWNPKIDGFGSMFFLFQVGIFSFHVRFQWCNWKLLFFFPALQLWDRNKNLDSSLQIIRVVGRLKQGAGDSKQGAGD